MKRVLSLALALFATVAVFAACNKEDKKEEVKEEWPKEFTGTVSVEFEGKTYSTDNKTISVEKGKEENTVTIIFNKIILKTSIQGPAVSLPEAVSPSSCPLG